MGGQFKIIDHVAISNRGVFVTGRIQAGTIRVGDQVASPNISAPLTITAVEFADTMATRESFVCLRFREHLSKAALQDLFPVGSIIEISGAA